MRCNGAPALCPSRAGPRLRAERPQRELRLLGALVGKLVRKPAAALQVSQAELAAALQLALATLAAQHQILLEESAARRLPAAAKPEARPRIEDAMAQEPLAYSRSIGRRPSQAH
jgi:hypothetical protein